ncbi:hypothetical protein DdX_17745 [Ditylenchus destructor]|uniref:Uncharacterized protein n=1 Tax=Ditylenchus destructor TaxID=166010 RepID=A0AAD4MRD0_9BILA|nr:hypothetical protein DdX_17745 [Ditylenchus destructor]
MRRSSRRKGGGDEPKAKKKRPNDKWVISILKLIQSNLDKTTPLATATECRLIQGLGFSGCCLIEVRLYNANIVPVSYPGSHPCVTWPLAPCTAHFSASDSLKSGQESNIGSTYYSFAEMRPYLGPTVRFDWTTIEVARDFIYGPDYIEEMESIAYLWRDRDISIRSVSYNQRIVAEDFQPILNSDYKILYTAKVIKIDFYEVEEINLSHWQQFFEQPGVKPIVVLLNLEHQIAHNFLDSLKEAFSSASSPNEFKIVFARCKESLTEFCETNKTSGEKLELKKGLPVEYQAYAYSYGNYTLERSCIRFESDYLSKYFSSLLLLLCNA